MKIAVSSSGTSLASQVDPRFGRCACFLIIETDDMSFEACSNENIALGGGAGIQSAQFMASKGVKAVLTGNCGPNAVRTLNAANIKLIAGQSGCVKDSVDNFINGTLIETTEPNVPDHYGMADNSSKTPVNNPGMGQGMRGMGGGRGSGRGMGMKRT